MKNCIVVLGMHRSGTSALTGILQKLGVELSDNLLPPNTDNPKGFFEHKDIVELHDRILEELNSFYDDFTPLPEEWWKTSGIERYKKEIIQVVTRDFQNAGLWGIKDPRISRMLPLWMEIFHQLEVTPQFAILYRPALEVVLSLHRRDGFSLNKSLLLWLAYNEESIRHTEHLPRVVVTFDDLLSDWQKVLRQISDTLSLRWPASEQNIIAEVDSFLSRDLRHHQQGSSLEGSKYEKLKSLADAGLLGLTFDLEGWMQREALHPNHGSDSFPELSLKVRTVMDRNAGWKDESAFRLRKLHRETWEQLSSRIQELKQERDLNKSWIKRVTHKVQKNLGTEQ